LDLSDRRLKRRLHNEELRNFFVSPNIIRVIELRKGPNRTCSTLWEDEKNVQNFDRKYRMEVT